jgi:pyruvate dehydrogenase E2 component (dihydrolipoamide acetyltransferase)
MTVTAILIKLVASALKQFPKFNSSLDLAADSIVHKKYVHIGVAVDTPRGLLVPVIRDADVKNVVQIAAELNDMAARARDRKLKPEEYQGGTTAVSNLGMFGIREFSAVINPPHATILAVGAGEKRPVVRDGALAAATIMTVTLSTDHRAVDGALGAELLQAFKGFIENPMGMLV